MSDHDTESPDTQRKRIKAMEQDPEMQQVAATARSRGRSAIADMHFAAARWRAVAARLATWSRLAASDGGA